MTAPKRVLSPESESFSEHSQGFDLTNVLSPLKTSDFETILISQNLDVRSKVVSDAILASGIVTNAESVSYEEFSKVLLRLESLIRKPATRDAKAACESVLRITGTESGKFNPEVLRKVFEGSAKGVLTDVQFKRMMEGLKRDSEGFIDLFAQTTEL